MGATGVQPPSSLQSFMCGRHFCQSLEGSLLSKRLEGIELLSCLQSLTFGLAFDRSLKSIQIPRSLQSLPYGHHVNQRLASVQLPSSLLS